jgi:hypothetical protein
MIEGVGDVVEGFIWSKYVNYENFCMSGTAPPNSLVVYVMGTR